ncbi:hypothetical protein [Marispirochaeta sp.]|uniref:hypothetical protein n=1 Tax=Marispirochaeta sp. TaxID=2038653 RepID=UPI0029C78A75|nr:hypothetical protein [Marispirochaeta sp.]
MKINYNLIKYEDWMREKKQKYGHLSKTSLTHKIEHKIQVAKYFLAEFRDIIENISPAPRDVAVENMVAGKNEDWNDFVQALQFIETAETEKHSHAWRWLTYRLLTLPKTRKNIPVESEIRKMIPMDWRYHPETMPLRFNPKYSALWDSVFSEYKNLWLSLAWNGETNPALAYFKMAWPLFAERIPEMIKGEIIEETPEGYDWKLTQESIKGLCRETGFNDYSGFVRYVSWHGKKISRNSLKNCLNYEEYPRDWQKVASIFF